MRLNTKMPEALKAHFNSELNNYITSYRAEDLQNAWRHLERAHVIGQSYPYQHTYVHWKMLQFGFKIKSTKEIIGQIPRLLVGGVKSFVGKIPVGNTGGADVPPLKWLPIEDDIMEMFTRAKVPVAKPDKQNV